MKILGAIGLGLTIIMLKFLMPRLIAGIEDTLLAFFSALQKILTLESTLLPASSLPAISGF